MEYTLKNLKEMEEFGLRIGRALKGAELIGLRGPLGAGKTTLTKSIAKALDVKEDIISPTFNIIKIYKTNKGELYHIDAYRLENLGYDPVLDDYIFNDNEIRIIEWYNFLDEDLFDNAIKIEIRVNPDQSRTISIEGGLCLE